MVDLYGGKASIEKNSPYNENTLGGIFSAGKNMVPTRENLKEISTEKG